MPVPKSAARLQAEEYAKRFPATPSRTLARKVASEFGMTVELARNLVRNARGAQGQKRRKHAIVDRPLGTAGTVPRMPPSKAQPYLPYVLKASRIASISDVHAPFHSELALGTAVEFLKEQEPDALLINGDFADFYAISRWQKDPRKRNFKEEIELVRESICWLRHEFPGCQIVYKQGNHEERWDHWLWNHAPEICDLEEVQLEAILKLEESQVTMVGEGRPIMCGKLPVLHGHELPKGLTNPVNMARGAFLRMIDTVLVGHGHRSSSHTESNWTHKEITCWSQGCLCDLTPDYARINRWNYGFAFIEVAEDGDFSVSNYRISKAGAVRKS